MKKIKIDLETYTIDSSHHIYTNYSQQIPDDLRSYVSHQVYVDIYDELAKLVFESSKKTHKLMSKVGLKPKEDAD